VLFNGTSKGMASWNLAGAHNAMNALAAVAAARHVGVPPKAAVEALSTFGGVKRRLEIRGVANGVTVYDDFAHHPTAIRETIGGLRRKVGNQRIVAVLEPRSNTMKLGAMRDALPGSLAGADYTFCYANNLGWDAGAALQPLGTKAAVFSDTAVMLDAMRPMLQPGDHVLIMSNGGFDNIHARLLEKLAA
jgi:UDP-N-acetylmuramate: L-alanyl-gamma-D-glutamyl-meso-diaminopimelate ligase